MIITTDEFSPSNLRIFREARKMSQGELARRSGLPRPSVTNYEAGKRTPTRPNIERMAAALDIPVSFLMVMHSDGSDDE